MTTSIASRTSAGSARTLVIEDFPAAVAAGWLVVDIRSTAQRERQGVLTGATAVEARQAIELLDPRSPIRLRSVATAEGVVLVSDDGFEAELFAWEIRARGANGVRALGGGFEALRRAGGVKLLAGALHVRRERSAIAAH